MGSEGDGVRHAIRRLADESWRIPIRGRLDSLNVSCALSATLSEIARRLPA
jgi:tRNA G18 (ribose-2'-O)-methylase SpoU